MDWPATGRTLALETGERVRIVPLHSNLVVDPFPLGKESRGGILIPQVAAASTPYRYATVLEVGPGRYAADGTLVPCTCKQGDIVAYSKNQGVEFPLDGEVDEEGNEKVVLLIAENYCIGVVKDFKQPTRITGLDGRLLTMMPQSNARQDSSYRQLDDVARARVDGIIDTQGGTLDLMAAQDQIDHESEPS
jgi:co-chaperonin GroES (HSP10)